MRLAEAAVEPTFIPMNRVGMSLVSGQEKAQMRPGIPNDQMGPLADKIIRFKELRGLLEEKFPEAQRPAVERVEGSTVLTPPGVVTEITGPAGSVGLLMLEMLSQPSAFAGVVDASDSFDPVDLPTEAHGRLLWVRCEKVAAAIQATDLLLRDGNLPVVFLDLRMVSARELRGIPASTWHRFQRILEQQQVSLGICTARPCIPAARWRVRAQTHWRLRDLVRPREELRAALRHESQARGQGMVEERQQRIA